MRRRVRALGHVAEVAHKALIDHFPIVLLGDTIDFHRGAFIYQVKQRWEGTAQTHATATPMADVKNTLEFIEAFFFVVEVWVLPIKWMACGGF